MKSYFTYGALLTWSVFAFAESLPEVEKGASLLSHSSSLVDGQKKNNESQQSKDKADFKNKKNSKNKIGDSGTGSDHSVASQSSEGLNLSDMGAKGPQFGGLSNRSFEGDSQNKSAPLGEIPYNSYNRAKQNRFEQSPSRGFNDDRPLVGQHKLNLNTNAEQAEKEKRSRAYQGRYKRSHHDPEDIRPLYVRPVHIDQDNHHRGDSSGGRSSGGKARKGGKPKKKAEHLGHSVSDGELLENFLKKYYRKDDDGEDKDTDDLSLHTNNPMQPSGVGGGVLNPTVTSSSKGKDHKSSGLGQSTSSRESSQKKKTFLEEDDVVESPLDDIRHHKRYSGLRQSLHDLDTRDEERH